MTRERVFDLDDLTPEERELWDRDFAPYAADPPNAVDLWSFGYACMLELSGPPPAVGRALAVLDPENKVLQYLENVRRSRAARTR